MPGFVQENREYAIVHRKMSVTHNEKRAVSWFENSPGYSQKQVLIFDIFYDLADAIHHIIRQLFFNFDSLHIFFHL